MSQDIGRTDSRILGALSKLKEDTDTLRNTDMENLEPTGDRSQNDPHPEMESSVYQSRHSIDSNPEIDFLRLFANVVSPLSVQANSQCVKLNR